MTPEERMRDALDLVERVRRRLAEARMTIEDEPGGSRPRELIKVKKVEED
jgi:hypothetical protein